MDKAQYIWMDGKLVAWDDAKIHILTHTLHYGNGVFEGTRAYMTDEGLAIFKQLRKTKFNKLLLLAEDENISVGDLIFEKMIECQSSENDFFNEMCS